MLDHFLLGPHYIYKHAGSLLAPDLSARRTLATLPCLPAVAAVHTVWSVPATVTKDTITGLQNMCVH